MISYSYQRLSAPLRNNLQPAVVLETPTLTAEQAQTRMESGPEPVLLMYNIKVSEKPLELQLLFFLRVNSSIRAVNYAACSVSTVILCILPLRSAALLLQEFVLYPNLLH